MKNYLVEFDINKFFPTILNYKPGLYKVCLRCSSPTISWGVYGESKYLNSNDRFLNVGSILVDGASYFKMETEAECFAQPSSFYFEPVSQHIIIHFENHQPPFSRVIYFGITEYFTAYWKDFSAIAESPALPLISQLPVIKQKKDLLNFDIMNFQSSSVVFNNEEGQFDEYKAEMIRNSELRVKHGDIEEPISAYGILYVGNAKSHGFSNTAFSITFTDTRSLLDYPVCKRKIDQNQYPYLKNTAEYVPVAYGDVKKGGAICLQETDLSRTSYDFMIMDTLDNGGDPSRPVTRLDHVYADEVEITDYTFDPATGIITAPYTVVRTSNGVKAVTCDFRGIDIDNSLDILRDILVTSANIIYSDTFFDTSEWETATAGAYDISLYVNSEATIKSTIKDICVSNKGTFFRKRDGRYSFRKSNYYKAPKLIIEKDMCLAAPEEKTDGDSFLSEITILYDKDYGTGESRKYVNDEHVLEIKRRFRAYKAETFPTLLKTEEDAIALAEEYLAEYLTQPRLFSVPIPLYDTNNGQDYILDLYDIVYMWYGRYYDKFGVFEVCESAMNLQKNRNDLVLQYIREVE